MKHIKIYEDFDLDKFMENPEDFFHDDSRPEIEEGDYITCYRGTGQVLGMDRTFAEIQLFDGPKTIVKVPIENLTKITREEAKKMISNAADSRKELKNILDQVNRFSDAVETTSDSGEEVISGNLESTLEYLEETLVEILTLVKKDPYTTQYQDYSNLVGFIARIAHYIMDQSPDPKIQDRTALVLDKFYEILD